jgi:trimeric autotransporter adhesin
MLNTSILKLALAALLAAGLIGCGDGGGYGGSGGGSGGGRGPTYTIGGTVTGLNGAVVLQNSGGDDLTVSADGAFAFSTALVSGRAYNVTIRTQPSFPAQDCVVTNSAGIASANVTNVAVTCSTLASAELQADADVHSARLSWASPAGASSFNVYVSSTRNCDIENFADCPEGALLMNVTSPHTIEDLLNGQAYFFRIETLYANGARSLSDEAGARPNELAFNAAVNAVATAEDGTVYLGGEFTRVGVTTGSAVPLDVGTGRVAAPDFPIVEGSVHALAPDGAGGWYLGGAFTRVAGLPRRNLAHVLANGSVDPNFSPEVSAPGGVAVRALAVAGSTVYVGGDFTTINNVTHAHLAAFDANAGGALLLWNPSPDRPVFALAVSESDSTIYVGGAFENINDHENVSQPRARLAAFGAEGTLLDWSPDADGDVVALAMRGNTIYAGGDFKNINSDPHAFLVAIDATGDGEPLSWNPAANRPVNALAVSGSTVYAGGKFTAIGEATRNRLAAIEADGIGELLPWDPDADDTVSALAISGSTVFAGGFFAHIGGQPQHGLAAIRADSGAAAIDADAVLLPWTSTDRATFALAVSGNTIYVGGSFSAVSSSPRNHLAAIDAKGTLLPWDPSADDSVLALAVSGSTVYAGGIFGRIGTEFRTSLAAINADGELLPWKPRASAVVTSPSVHALAISGNTVYAGGHFASINGDFRSCLAAIKADGEGELLSWKPEASGPTAITTVHALAISGSTIYAGGDFTGIVAFNPAPITATRNRLVAIDESGALLSWDPNADKAVVALEVVGNTVFAGGHFTRIGTTTRNHLAAIDADGVGKLQDLWNPDPDRPVLALAASGDTLYVGGSFEHMHGETRSHLAALDPSGVPLAWDPSSDRDVRALALTDSGNKVHIGGDFRALGGAVRSGLGTVDATGAGDITP